MAEKTTYDWNRGFTLDFSLLNGLSQKGASTKRKLSQMKGMYADSAAFDQAVAEGDPLVYEFYELGVPEHPGDLAFGTSITYSGKVGNEYYMTKGHFHTILETAEVYYTLSGEGFMLTENPEGDVILQPLYPGIAVYIPKRYAHRSINSGKTPLITFFAFRADAGHDYGTIETKGYRKLVVEGLDGKPRMIDNPRWA
ncbi:MAG: glucose-6-phosphate isomerase [Treponema sp.]|jgi:glucose-6-phosphate isomerase|nr:glucose-6-phosphate isomerase [Treponema sp.]